MVLLYNIAIRVYYFFIFIASLWNEKAKKWIAGRRNTRKDIIAKKDHNKRTIWFHCASVGEYEQALPLIKICRQKYSGFQILTTFYSPSGYEYAKNKFPGEWVSYLPLDTKNNMAVFIAEVNPALVFIIKYEFWYHLLFELNKRSIPLFLVSGIFRKEQLFFKSAGFFQRKMLGFFTHLFVQNESSKMLLETIHIENVSVAGDTRFDRVAENKNEAFYDEKIEKFLTTDRIFIAGSVWDSDIPVLKEIMNALPADWKIILAPHEINHFHTGWIQDEYAFYTGNENEQSRILIIDTIGILSKLYRYAKFVYVGGGFGKGIHNILEPAVYLKPILIGGNYSKFAEAVELVREEAVFSIKEENAADFVKKILLDENKYKQAESRLMTYISTNTNLSEKIIVYVSRYLNF